MNLVKFLKSKRAKNYEAMIVVVEGRRFLCGFTRKQSTSRKFKEKLMLPMPFNLDAMGENLTPEERAQVTEVARIRAEEGLPTA